VKLAAFRFLSVVLGLLLSVVLLELFATAYLTLRDGRYESGRERFLNSHLMWSLGAGVTPVASYYCRHIDTLFPHPYLGWVYHGNPPCGYPDSINNIGLHRHDFPAERATDHFVILLTGGSVSEYVGGGNQLHVGGELHPPYLERALNARWTSADGKSFVVLQGGAGGWKQPQQAIMLLLYADMIDAVVTLDGANEFLRTLNPTGQRFETPFQHFQEANPLASASFSKVIWQWLLANGIAFLRSTPPFSYSSLAYLVADRVSTLIEPADTKNSNRRTTVASIFAAPKEWDKARYWEVGQEQYHKYIREMHAVAAEFGIRDAYFLQSMPAIKKTLTEEERKVVGDLSYRDKYVEWVDNTLKLRAKGIAVYDMLDVFENEKGQIYQDGGHSLWNDATHEARGYTLIAERMAETLAKAWNFKPKESATVILAPAKSGQ